MAPALLTAIAAVVIVFLETTTDLHYTTRMRLTIVTVCAFLYSLIHLCLVFTGMDGNKDLTYVVEDVFPLTDGGCVVLGKVQGIIDVGAKIAIFSRYGVSFKPRISAMEINRRTVNTAKDTYVALQLKDVLADDVHKGDTILPFKKPKGAE